MTSRKRYGVIGSRSWIAQALMRYLAGLPTSGDVISIQKDELSRDPDLSEFDAVFLFAGRARPTFHERIQELVLVSYVPTLTRPPKKMVYISSLAVERESTQYTQTKLLCESMVLAQPGGLVLRPPVVFGPGQDPNADMLFPQIARAVAGKEDLVLRQPFMPFHLMYVDDVCHGAWLLAEDTGRSLPTTGDRKILRLMSSEPWSPLDVLRAAAPGIPFITLGGWTLPPQDVLRQVRDDENAIRRSVSSGQVADTIKGLVRKIDA
jgi:nucleoside-diphosphate-sugar epimerase